MNVFSWFRPRSVARATLSILLLVSLALGMIAAAPAAATARNATAAPIGQLITLRANANNQYVSAD